ncbi:MAG TPA: OstA-like protein, partial [Saprospiraceae bacterium]|nr:OstA-like protein [Saprospiraceae bacterium]
MLLSFLAAFAQQDTAKNRIQVIHADVFRFERTGGKEIQYLSRDVLVRHKNSYLLCDSAIIDGNKMLAMGHVRIVEGDSLQIFGDSLKYDGDQLLADFIGNIVLKHKTQELFTNLMRYDLKNRVASYFDKGVLFSESTQLKSNRGYYYAKTGHAYFKDSVVVLMPDSMVLLSDSLVYETKNKLVRFTGPTLIEQDSLQIYCEAGYYNVEKQRSYFGNYPRYQRGSQKADARDIFHDAKNRIITLVHEAYIRDDKQEARADSIVFNEATQDVKLFRKASYKEGDRELIGEHIEYNRKTKSLHVFGKTSVTEAGRTIDALRLDYDGVRDLGLATGNVVVNDTVSGYSIYSDTFYYSKSNSSYRALGGKQRAYIATAFDNDSLFLSADSLLSKKQTEANDTFQVLYAWGDVRIWSPKLQGLCDSLYYSGKDSIFYLFDDPVLWSDTSQFTGDTIWLAMARKSLKDIYLRQDAFIINHEQVEMENQLKGREIQAHFDQKKIRFMDVQGNAESVYFIQDADKG